MSNRLNQDCLENHFTTIRGRGGFRDNPDSVAFGHTFRQVFVQQMLSVKSSASNCEEDMPEFLLRLQDTTTVVCAVQNSGFKQSTASVQYDEQQVLDLTCDEISDVSIEDNAVLYVGGYVCKRVIEDHDCETCRNAMLNSASDRLDSTVETFLQYQLYVHCSLSSLHRPAEAILAGLMVCRDVFASEFANVKFSSGVLQSLFDKCMFNMKRSTLLSAGTDCAKATVKKAVNLFLRILLFLRDWLVE